MLETGGNVIKQTKFQKSGKMYENERNIRNRGNVRKQGKTSEIYGIRRNVRNLEKYKKCKKPGEM